MQTKYDTCCCCGIKAGTTVVLVIETVFALFYLGTIIVGTVGYSLGWVSNGISTSDWQGWAIIGADSLVVLLTFVAIILGFVALCTNRGGFLIAYECLLVLRIVLLLVYIGVSVWQIVVVNTWQSATAYGTVIAIVLVFICLYVYFFFVSHRCYKHLKAIRSGNPGV